MPKVSVVVPVYSVESFIEKCAQSLFEQTLKDVEFIFVDDCSPDNSMAVLKAVIQRYQDRISRMNWTVRTARMPVNSGLPAVRKQGMELASGEFIINCDSDDWVDPDMLETMYNAAVENRAELVTCEIDWSNGCQFSFHRCKDKMDLINATLTGCVIESVCTKLIKRSILTRDGFVFPVDNVNEDCVLSVQVAYYCNSFVQLPNKFYHYLMREGSISHVVSPEKVINNFYQFIRNISIIEDFLSRVGLYNDVKEALAVKKVKCRNYIIPIVADKEGKALWTSTYKKDIGIVLFNRMIPFRTKIIHYSVKFNVYNFLRPAFSRKHD